MKDIKSVILHICIASKDDIRYRRRKDIRGTTRAAEGGGGGVQ